MSAEPNPQPGIQPGKVSSRWAFKEWAVVCEALVQGRQSILLRKGGIHEEGGVFRPEHDRFWLYPTRFHQSPAELIPGTDDLIAAAKSRASGAGTIQFSEFVQVQNVEFVSDEAELALYRDRHILSNETVHQRFHYRRPGLYVLEVDVFRTEEPVVIEEHPDFAGCKTWVELPEELTATVFRC